MSSLGRYGQQRTALAQPALPRPTGRLTATHPARPRLLLRTLGPLAARRDGEPVDLGPPRQRAVLGVLALSPGVLVHRDTIIDALWADGSAPVTAVNLVQAYMSRLRRALGIGRSPQEGAAHLTTIGCGYRLHASAAELDVLAFQDHVAQARAAHGAGAFPAACDRYERALRLWRGDPLADVDLLRAHPIVAALCTQRARAVMEYAEAAAGAGRHERALPYLQSLTAQERLNEKAHALLMVALAGSGQQAAALLVHEELRRRLDDELGVRPGAELSAAHLRVLRQEVTAAGHLPAATGDPDRRGPAGQPPGLAHA